MAWLLALTIPAALNCWWLFTRHEVTRNAADISADGAADTLKAGYHQRRTWVRAEVAVALALAGACPAPNWPTFALLAAALLVLLAGYFARYFTPALNLERNLPAYQASQASASWPDSAAWEIARATYPNENFDYVKELRQQAANDALARLLRRAWRACYWLAAALAAAGFYYCLR